MERYSKVSFMSKSANDINEVSLGQESPMTLATGHEPQSHRSIDMLLKDTSRVIRKNSLEPLEKQNSQSSISSSKSTSSKLSGSDLSVKLTGKCPPTEREINKPVSLRLDANEIVSKIKGGGGAIAANKNLHVFPVDDEEDESSRSRSYMVGGRISSVFKNVFQASTAIEMAGPVAEKGHLVEIGSRKLLIWSDTDVELFYSIYDWKQRNPSARKRQCQSLFTNLHSASDAIIDFVFRESKFDYILKYDSNNPHQNIRDTYEKAVLELGCFLEIEMSREVNNEFFIKVITPFRVLCRAAENYKLRRPLKPLGVEIPRDVLDEINHSFEKRMLGNENVDLNINTAPFKFENLRQFNHATADIPDHEIQGHFFKPFYRSLLTKYILEGVQIKIQGRSSVEEQKFNVNYLTSQGIYERFFYPHERLDADNPHNADMTIRERILKTWVKNMSSWKNQELKDLREYFGEKVALHFAFVKFYRGMLISFSVAGLAVFLFGIYEYGSNSGTSSEVRSWRRLYDNQLSFWFALAISLWSTFFLELWKRRSNFLSYIWLTYSLESEERNRHSFEPTELKLNLVTGLYEPSFPFKKRAMLRMESIMVILFFMLLIIGSVIVQNTTAVYMANINISSIYISVTSAILGVVLVQVLHAMYSPVAVILNNRENHQTNTDYDDNLIVKQWLFNFVNIFSRLFYYAFVRQDHGELFDSRNFIVTCIGSCSTDLFIQVTFQFFADTFTGRVNEYLLPWFQKIYNEISAKKRAKRFTVHPLQRGKSGSLDNIKKLPQYYTDEKLPPAEGADADYLQKIVQFAVLTGFSVVFPLAPLFSLLSNSIEIHTDVYKYIALHQRAPPIQAQDIGTWYAILKFHSVLAVSVNAGIIIFCFETFNDTFLIPFWSPASYTTVKLAYFVLWHIVIHGFNFIIAYVVPDVPEIVRVAFKRQGYLEKLRGEQNENEFKKKIMENKTEVIITPQILEEIK